MRQLRFILYARARSVQISKFKLSCVAVCLGEMATQNIAPSTHSSSQKGVDSTMSNQKDGHSVTKRLQQDLMTLMVRV